MTTTEYLALGGIVLLVVLMIVGVSLFLARTRSMSDGKQALGPIGAALVLFVVMLVLFGAFYEPSF